MDIKISIIIATRNRHEYVLDLLDDLEKQDKPVYEVLISDQSINFKLINSKYSFKLIHFKNNGSGPCISRNDAVNRSSGNLLIFLDDDARIDIDFIKEITHPLLDNKASACCGAIVNIKGEFSKEKRSFKVGYESHFILQLTNNPDNNESGYCNSAPAGCYAIFKSIFIKLDMYDTFFDPNGAGEDRDFSLKMMLNGHSTYYNHKAKLYHIGASSGGRKSSSITTPLAFRKNICYILKKHLGNIECQKYRLSVCKNRLKRVIRFDMPLTQVLFVIHFLNISSKKMLENKKEL